jgi:hypothetical protein
MTSMLPKIAALGTAALGFTMLKDNNEFTAHEAGLNDHHMVEHDYLAHAYHTSGDYSPYSTLNHIKHSIFTPTNWHCIRRPLVYIKAYADLLWNNIVPIGLSFVGLTWLFGGSVPKNLTYCAKKTAGAVGMAGRGVASLSTAAVDVYRRSGWRMPRPNLDSKGKLMVGLAGAMGLYVLHKFKRELTDENKLEAMNYLQRSGH